ncbi:NACHT domain-containing protein [Amycolatopsis sp. NPDC051106]|uniref:NACHT domain-containing protein n=1 Tax=unclassified Amycolatopsis TaxID=2618356 RepID=UPI003413B71F
MAAPDPINAFLWKVAAQAAAPLIKRLRGQAAKRGFGKGDIFTISERNLGIHKDAYWPVSLVELLPPGLTQRDIDRFIETPEMTAFARHLVSLHIAGGHEHAKQRVFASLTESLTAFVMPEKLERDRTGMSELQERMTLYATRFCEHLDESCRSVANLIKAKTESAGDVQEWAYDIVATEVLNSIDSALEHLSYDVRSRTSLAWLPQYRALFAKRHRKINSPDITTRRTLDYRRIFVEPSVRQIDRGARFTPEDFPDFAKRVDRSVLLGDPGAGKSTSCTVLAIQAASAAALTPFVVVLRQLDSPDFYLVDLLAGLLRERYEVNASRRSIEKLLHEGDVLLVFDGLDEIIDNSQRLRFAEKIESIGHTYPFAKILVTCRKVGYLTAKLNGDQFTVFSILPFSKAQVTEYVSKWFGAQENIVAKQVTRFVADFIADTREMQDLTENPLLLSFMCVLYRGLRSIPEDRAELYEECTQLLLGRRDKHFGIVKDVPSVATMKTALSRIARSETNSGSVGLTERQIKADLVPFLARRVYSGQDQAAVFIDDFLSWCRGRAWIFTDFGPDRNNEDLFTFTHASFREYFAALYFVRTNRDAAKVVDHLYPLVESGRSEIYAQVCCSLFEDALLSGASAVVIGLIDLLEQTHPAASINGITEELRSTRLRCRSVGSVYLTGIANCVSLTAEALDDLAGLAIDEIALGNTAAAARVLDPAFKHHEAMLTLLTNDLARGDYSRLNDAIVRRARFAVHAGYLLAAGQQHVTVKRPTLDKLAASVGSAILAGHGELGLRYALRLESGAIDGDEFAALEPAQLAKTFSFFFGTYALPAGTLGPGSVATWILDCFQIEHRAAMPVARVVALLKKLHAGVAGRAECLLNMELPELKESVFLTRRQFQRAAMYSVECRSAMLLVLIAQAELNERLQHRAFLRATLVDWAHQLGSTAEIGELLRRWSRGEVHFWLGG